ncbi:MULTISPECIES: type II toxin-antitoxin system RelE/ParE family toxin [Stenotrophomonas]|uniref:type II toxin-antitoxin system RelE/ParE family toxin n=1 Tax=Stenotrophomonas TaxID=40323 RepID=UPI000872A0D2|nr:type II toxin-antitoxin system RelE/ParE family toxin [Stenotrophomonas sp. BIIR7]OEZ00986.1 hypothetical protein BIY45_08870 [Stenotrophomonas sp. BIIR7]
MTELLVVKLTANFERSLEEIRAFFVQNDAPDAFDALLEDLTDRVVPNLERFPLMGRSFLSRPIRSVETTQASSRLRNRLDSLAPDGDIREYMMSQYVMLYAITESTVYMLSIRHHQKVSFDLAKHWSD